ncbi:hypothetical protein F2Q68_00033661 [Brassica cretica]|uniref:Uncharacterized protein n=2 Tax=Brassica cretica TaxID=69181 RepID=A0A8S9GTU1_BRACR|nr:hypothetical protein F2Q68_00033662 [Brassica cretica]KAF2550031.1 hypothetical protein F2Q68_00033661 [Brassica cretica]KAF3592306.1 hypothetical protein DY000_02020696 [Brassica cretica]KAF3592307.1 hypothetical protein DY000_02020695 [Brassica cretica]
MEDSPYRKFSISQRKGGDPGTGPGKLRSGEPWFLLTGILGTGVPSSGDPEAGVLPGVWRNSIPELPVGRTSLQLSSDPGFHSGRNRILNPGDDQFPLRQTGTVEPGALMFPEEELA